MGELKSAWEIAQGKADKLGKLSAEEERQQKEEECRQIGMAVAQKYLDHPELQDITAMVNNYPEGKRDMIRKAVLSCLAEGIELKSLNLEKVIQGIAMLESRSQLILEQITQLTQEYEQAERKAREGLQSEVKETLHRLRISGTAVGDINMEGPPFEQSRQRLMDHFAPRLDTLRRELIRFFALPC